MAKHTLQSTGDELDFELIGIVSPENRYVLLSAINDALGIDLALAEDLQYNLKGGNLFYFSLYHFPGEDLGIDYYFISNSSNFENENASNDSAADLFSEMKVEESTRLVKELPKTDYFLILKGEELHHHKFRIIELLKAIKEIVQVQSIEPEDLPSRMNLIF